MTDLVHEYSPQDASRYGIEIAVILQLLRVMLRKNRVDYCFVRDGFVWVPIKIEVIQAHLPYFSKSQVSRYLRCAIEKGALIDGNYNESKWNHTKWYTLPEFELTNNNPDPKNKHSDSSNQSNESDVAKLNIVNSKNTQCSKTKTQEIKVSHDVLNSNLVDFKNKHSVQVLNNKKQQDDLIDFDMSLARPYVQDSLSNCTNNNQDLDFEIFSTPRPMTEKTELPDIPITNGRRMTLGRRAIACLKAMCPTGLLSEIVTEYVGWLAFDAIYPRSRFETVLRDLTQRIQQAISERKYGYGY